MNEQLAISPTRSAVGFGQNGLQLTTMDDAFRFSNAVSQSGLAPKGIERPEAIFVAIQMGAEIGLTPMAALQNIAIINGRPGIFGDAALALVRASGLMESYSQKMEGEGDTRRAIVTSQRKGGEKIESTFSVGDAKKAGLWGKGGPWSQYPERMLLFRARGFNLRDNFGDVLKGLRTTEELGDIDADLPVKGADEARVVNATTDAPKENETPAERPKIARRGGARAAAAEAAATTVVEVAPAATEEKPSAGATPAAAAPVSAPPSEPAKETPAAPAATNVAPAASACPEVAPGINLEGFHGKAWPIELKLTIKGVSKVATNAAKQPVALLFATAEGHEGDIRFVTFEGVGVKDGKVVVTNPDILDAGKVVTATVRAKQVVGTDKNDPAKQVMRTDVAPSLWLENITPVEVEQF